ncbi:MAG: division/cell wall cluster transcriptional repressor MraZ [Oscillospiraceae bacterium]|nr:division/cell wall cluster transcriptional repressor MraZ [Oscillospiraceae bacterium]
MTSTYYHNLDAKGRMNFPAKLREVLGDTFVVAKDATGERCLCVYPMAHWQELIASMEAQPGVTAAKLRRWLMAGAVEVTPDKQGRILLPQNLRDFAGLEKDVAVVGAGYKAEIWNLADWEKEDESFDPAAIPETGTLRL